MAESTAGAPAAKPPATRPAASKAAPPPAPVAPTGVTRREFLYYVWGASMALFLAETAGISVFFALPRFRVGEFGGKIIVNTSDFPQVDGAPVPNNVGKFWMVTTDQGIMAHYKVCPHLGCIYAWDDLAKHFACPCHGSQYQLDGTYIAGPAPRGLDRFTITEYDASNKPIATSQGLTPLPLDPNAVTVSVDTGAKVTGKSHF